MAHEIFGARFIGVREPAWHGLGTILPEAISAVDALGIAGIDFTYEVSPLMVETPDGQKIEIPNRQAILRSPTADDPQWRTVGVSSHEYDFVQNDKLAEGLDQIAAATGWTFETAGALKEGAGIFMTLQTPDGSVKGDRYKNFILVQDSKTSGKSLQISVVPLRVVCQNTLIAATAAANFDVKIRHGRGIQDEYTFWTGLVPRLQKRQEEVFAELNHMADVKISKQRAETFFSEVYPLPEKSSKLRVLEMLDMSDEKLAVSHEYWTAHALRHREAAYQLFERFNDSDEQGGETNNSSTAGTVYAALQAVTELADWGGSSSANTGSALFGSRAKVKSAAWKFASTY